MHSRTDAPNRSSERLVASLCDCGRLIPVSILLLACTLLWQPLANAAEIELRYSIFASENDAEQKPNRVAKLDSDDLDFDGKFVIGLRFPDVGLRFRADVKSAHIQFTAKETSSTTSDISIRLQTTGIRSAFSAARNDITDRPTTSSSVEWSVPNWTAGARGAAQRTPDLTGIINEVTQSNWNSGNNNLVFIMENTGDRKALTFDSMGIEDSPELVIVLNVEDGDSVFLSYPIVDGSDDAEQAPGQTVVLDSNDLDFKSDQTVGLRFRKVAIPRFSNIDSATLVFTPRVSADSEATLNFRGEAVGHSPRFQATLNNLTNRPQTTSFVTGSGSRWHAQNGGTEIRYGVRELIQEIVDSPDWVAGNALTVLVNTTGERIAHSYESGNNKQPRLEIGFSPPIPTPGSCEPFPGAINSAAELEFAIECYNTLTEPGHYQISLQRDIRLLRELPWIDNPRENIELTINGNGHDLTSKELILDHDDDVRGSAEFWVLAGSKVTFFNIVFNTDEDSRWEDPIVSYGDTRLDTVQFIGAGNVFRAYSGQFRVVNSAILHSESAGWAAGVFEFIDSVVHGNGRDGRGGIVGIALGTDDALISGSTFSDNYGLGEGGTALAVSGRLTIVNSTFLNNGRAEGNGGAIIAGYNADLTILNSTFYANSGEDRAGAILQTGGTLTLENNIFTNNGVSPFDPPPIGGEIYVENTVVMTHNNIFGDVSVSTAEALHGFTPSSTDFLATLDGTHPSSRNEIVETPLQSNNESTETLALVPGSIAINNGDTAVCLQTPVSGVDQRGVARNVGPYCDIGAFETNDGDFDSIPDDVDNCPVDANPNQQNSDTDSDGNACDNDDDNDGELDDVDNCPVDSNPGQHNNDNDGQGDVCDPDDDNDGIPDEIDPDPFTPAETTDVQNNVVANSDDAEQKINRVAKLLSDDLDFDGVQRVGIRFTGVNVPKGAEIQSAHIQFHSKSTDSATSELRIRSQSANNPPTFVDVKNNITSRSLSQEQVVWDVPPWTENAAGEDERTPDLSTLIQVLVDRDGWQAGNAIVFVIESSGLRRALSVDSVLSDGPVLTISYGGGGGGIETVSTPEFSPTPGNYSAAIDVEITSDQGAVIYTTDDGTDPTQDSSAYGGPINLAVDTTIKARAYRDGYAPSEIAVGQYTFSTGAEGVIERRIERSNDDAESKIGARTKIDSNDLDFGEKSGTGNPVGLLFRDIAIPPGAVVTSAYVQFVAISDGSGQTNLIIEGELDPGPNAFQTTHTNIDNRPRTANNVEWNALPSWSAGDAGLAQRTPDLSNIVQELVDQAEWASGNTMVLIISGSGSRSAYAWDEDPSFAAELVIEFQNL